MSRSISNRKNQGYMKSSNSSVCLSPQLFSCIIAILCYTNSLFGDFVFDDFEAIETNFDVRPQTPLKTIFKNDFWGYPLLSNISHKSYRPLTILTFRWNYYYGGLRPVGYHAVNIVLHGVVSALFVSLCNVIFRGLRSRTALVSLAGTLFVLHPIHTEAVANVVGRADTLSALFYILALLSYANSFHEDSSPNGGSNKKSAKYSKVWIGVCAVCGALSLLCKEQGITVLGVCAIYDVLCVCRLSVTEVYCALRNPLLILKPWPKKIQSLVGRLVFITLSTLFLLYLRIGVLAGGLPMSFGESDNPTSFHDDIATRWRTYFYLWAFNGWLLLCPAALCYDWSMDSIRRVESIMDFRNVASVGLICVGACLAFYVCNRTSPRQVKGKKSKKYSAPNIDGNENVVDPSDGELTKKSSNPCNEMGSDELHRRRVVLFSLGMIVIPFLPASNLFFPVGFVVAERVLYIPSMGFAVLAALGITALFGWDRQQKQQQAHQQINHHEQQRGKVTEDSKEDSSCCLDLTFGLNKLGTVCVYGLLTLFAIKTLSRNAEWKDTEALAISGLKVNPGNAKIYLTMGNVLAQKGLRASEKFYREALRLRPQYTAAWVNLGLVLLNTGRSKQAEEHYRKALSIKPESADANTNLAHLLRVTNRLHDADRQYSKAHELRPGDPHVCFQHGVVLEKLGRKKEAEVKYAQAAQLNPTDPRPILATGRMLATSLIDVHNPHSTDKKKSRKAEEYLRRGLMMQPDNLDTRLLLASLLLTKGQLSAAELEARALLTRDKYNEEAEFILGKVLERKGLLKEAKQLYRQVLKKNHSHAGARASLDDLLQTQ